MEIKIGQYIGQAGDVTNINTQNNYYGPVRRKPDTAVVEEAEIVEEVKEGASAHGLRPAHNKTTYEQLGDAIRKMIDEGTLRTGTHYWAVHKVLSSYFGFSKGMMEFQNEAESRLHLQDIEKPRFKYVNWYEAGKDFTPVFKTSRPDEWRGLALKGAQNGQRKVAFRLMQLMGLFGESKEDWLATYTGFPSGRESS